MSLLTRQHWTNLVQTELTNQVAFLQEQLQSGHPVNDVANFFYDLPGVPARRSKIIVPTTGEHAMKSVNLPELFASESYKRMFNTFLYPSKLPSRRKDYTDRVDDPTQATPVSMWVVGDLDSRDGFRVVKDALQHIQSEDCTSRLGFIHVPTSDSRISTGHSASLVLHQLVSMSALRTVTAEEILDLIEHMNEDDESFKKRADGPQKPLDHLRHKGIQSLALKGWGMDQEVQNPYSAWEEAGTEIARKLGIDATKPHLIVNGRASHTSGTYADNQLVGPLSASTFADEDFAPLETYEYRKRAKPVVDLLKTMYEDITIFDRATLADLVSSVSSVLTTAYKSDEGESIFVAPPTPRSRYYESLDKGIMYVHTHVRADL
jgi:UDP-glucose:glycoprotein glucosyltransferase